MHVPSIGVMIILLIIVVLLFGQGKVVGLAGELGSALREFKKGLEGREEDTKSPTAEPPAPVAQPELPAVSTTSQATNAEAARTETPVPMP